MPRPILYLMVGYPGSGKTTAARYIHELTGAVHIWADHERKNLFARPTHTEAESRLLYTKLNEETARLLREGKSVIFDTNFNFYKDRQHLRQIAAENGADTKLLWVHAPKELALQRATTDSHKQSTRALGDMTPGQFEHIADKLEAPTDDEQPIPLDGTKMTPEYIAAQIGIR